MSRRKRKLTADEQALWDIVARRTEPLREKPEKPKIFEAEPTATLPKKPAIKPFSVGQSASSPQRKDQTAPTLAEQFHHQPVVMDAKAFQRLKRGKLEPEARIDLHGLTLSEAHPELISFVMNASAKGLRLILVITGKGKDRDEGGPIPTRFGVLRHQVPQWLRMVPLGPFVLQVTPAAPKHGGQGALYVYLRRRR